MRQVINFNPGPAVLPQSVLQQAAAAVLDLDGAGMSVLEISHRARAFEAIYEAAHEDLLQLMGLDAGTYSVLFLGGGASLQFFSVPRNLLPPDGVAAYVDTGVWSQKAVEQARRVGRAEVVGSSASEKYARLPEVSPIPAAAAYLHITTNNTIEGTQFHQTPETGAVPLVADMSSDFLATDRDFTRFALMYAGAQKNIGPAGVTIVVIRRSLLDACREDVPEMLSYRVHEKARSVYNTPPVFGVYVVGLVCRWVKEQGGVAGVAAANRRKAELVYGALDAHPDVYEPTVTVPAHRSLVNITFRLRDASRESEFLDGARERHMVGLRGHRAVGGFRASMYNAFEEAWAERFADYLHAFARL